MDTETVDYLRRNSGLRLTREGVFIFHGDVVPNPRVQTLFHSGLDIETEGDVTLTVGEQWAYVECDGVARFIDWFDMSGDALHVLLKGGARSRCTDPHLGYGPDERFYLWQDPEAFPAVAARKAHQQLAGLLDAGEHGASVLRFQDQALEVEELGRAPRAHERRRQL